MRLSKIQFHSECLTAVILEDDPEGYEPDGGPVMCGACRRRWKTAHVRATKIMDVHEARLSEEAQRFRPYKRTDGRSPFDVREGY